MLQPIIGLEIHLQLKTRSKMFCSCAAHETTSAPNTNICPICMGHPGTLPVPNEQAVRFGILMGLALGCDITPFSKFDRKNYFYPDLPKGYQISQYDLPIAVNGQVEVDIPTEQGTIPMRFGITRAHLEEDAGKNIHGTDGKTYVDFNRAGMPLLEIVTEPDFRSAQAAKTFLQELRLIARCVGISDADMEKGQMRCDANVSLRELDDNGNVVGLLFNPKTEVKNLNSFRHVERALLYEIQRQTKLFEQGTPQMISMTRGWNDATQMTEEQRTKEAAGDYRYFPEPDIPPLELKDLTEELKQKLPELPTARRARFVQEYGLRPEDARLLCEDPILSDYTEAVFSELQAWLHALPELEGVEETVWEKERARLAKLVASWLVSKLGGLLSERGLDYGCLSGSAGKIDPENFAEFITLIATNKLTSSTGLTVLNTMLDDGSDPSHIMEEKRLGRMDDQGELAEVIDRVLAMHPNEVERYKAGKTELLQMFIGKVMKETEGNADATITKNILLVKLGS